MKHDLIPENFAHFSVPIDKILIRNPISISLVGSYGDTNKKPTSSSDLDLIFVFRTDYIYQLYQAYLKDLYKIKNLEIVELGVHFQYGYVISIYYVNKPMCWVDIGIMDLNFAKHYLVNLSRTEVFGSIRNSGIGQDPVNQMNHLARKIIRAYNDKHDLVVEILCHRYLSWWKVYADIQERKAKQKETYSEITKLFNSCSCFNGNTNIADIVMNDIQNKFPEISCMKEQLNT